jgi:hypothetical protein
VEWREAYRETRRGSAGADRPRHPHQTHDAAARESKRLEHPDLARALAHTHHQGVANDHQDRHERRSHDQDHDQCDIAELGDERLVEGLFGVGCSLVGRVGERLVDCLHHTVV